MNQSTYDTNCPMLTDMLRVRQPQKWSSQTPPQLLCLPLSQFDPISPEISKQQNSHHPIA
jgi:hypothetical protein